MNTETSINDGGCAFPCQPLNAQNNPMGPADCGMSIRDFFAAHSLSGWAAGRNNGNDFMEPSESKAQFVAESCYLYADAMIAARSK